MYPPVSILYFGQFNPFHYSPLPLPSHPLHYVKASNTIISSQHRCSWSNNRPSKKEPKEEKGLF
jgi:hypothetical protein